MSDAGGLVGRTVVVTREEPGVLATLLAERGAQVVHVPVIAVVDPVDGGAELGGHLDRLGEYDWLVVTSAAGAVRVAAAARRHPGVRLAAVGTSTARALAESVGREVDLVPDEQRGAALAAALGTLDPARMLLAVADRAPATLGEDLVAAGHDVTVVTAYRTIATRGPDAETPPAGDALLLASGSAAQAWVERFGTSAPAVIVAIGPSTEAVATRSGLKVSAVASDHSLTGLVTALERCFGSSEASG